MLSPHIAVNSAGHKAIMFFMIEKRFIRCNQKENSFRHEQKDGVIRFAIFDLSFLN
jgi:hypothetical protein